MNICICLPEWAWITLAAVLGIIAYGCIGALLACYCQYRGWITPPAVEQDAFVVAFFWPVILPIMFLTWLPRKIYYTITRNL